MASVAKTLETIDDVGELVVDVIAIVRRGVGLGSVARLLEVVSDLTELADDAPKALPELVDLDAAEAGQIAAASYALIKKILASV